MLLRNSINTRPKGMLMERGTVKFFNTTKGFGFITTDSGDLFCHISQRARTETGTPGIGDEIFFIRQDGRKGQEAGRWQLTKEVTKQPDQPVSTIDLVNGPEKDREAGYRPGVLVLLRD